MIYFVMFVIAVFFGIWYEKDKMNINTCSNSLICKRNCLILLAFLPVFFLSAFRKGIGTDYYYTYVPVFEKISEGISTHVEFGYYLINKLVILLNGNVQWVFVITSLIFCVNMYLFIFKLSENIGLSIVLLLLTETYFFSFNVIRQAIATSFFLAAIPFIIKKKPIHYFVLIILAISFHQLAVVYLPVYFINKVNITFRKDMILTGLVGILFLTNKFFSGLIQFFVSKTRFQWYLDSVYSTEGYPGSIITLFLICILICYLYVSYKFKDDLGDKFVVFKSIHYITCIILALSPIIPNSYRILMLFIPVLIVSLITLINYIPNRYIKYLSVIIFTVFLIWIFVKRSIILGYNEVFPYSSIFSQGE